MNCLVQLNCVWHFSFVRLLTLHFEMCRTFRSEVVVVARYCPIRWPKRSHLSAPPPPSFLPPVQIPKSYDIQIFVSFSLSLDWTFQLKLFAFSFFFFFCCHLVPPIASFFTILLLLSLSPNRTTFFVTVTHSVEVLAAWYRPLGSDITRTLSLRSFEHITWRGDKT